MSSILYDPLSRSGHGEEVHYSRNVGMKVDITIGDFIFITLAVAISLQVHI